MSWYSLELVKKQKAAKEDKEDSKTDNIGAVVPADVDTNIQMDK